MVAYECEKCKTTFYRKQDFDRHQKRKTDCSAGSKTNKRHPQIICEWCGGGFSRSDSLARHKLTCKYKKNVKPLITLTSFAKDGIKNITCVDLSNILNPPGDMVEKIILRVNFNANKPHHHNILYTDLKSSHGEVYEDGKWIKKLISEILNTLINSKCDDLNQIIIDLGDHLSEITKNRIKQSIKNVDYRDKDTRNCFIRHLKPVLVNNRNMVINTGQLIKQHEIEYPNNDTIT